MSVLLEFSRLAKCDRLTADTHNARRTYAMWVLVPTRGEIDMAKGEQRSNREKKKPKKEKIKAIAAAPSQKTGGWQPTQDTGKKK